MLDKAKKTAGKLYGTAKDRAEGAYEAGRGSVEGVYDGIRGKVAGDQSEVLTAWCSWCGTYGDHVLSVKRVFGRSTYVCQSCDLNTLPCRFCDNMAKAVLESSDATAADDKKSKITQFFKDNWNDELCAEHDGSMPNFARANDKIRELGEFRQLMKPKERNLYGLAKNAGVVVGGVAAVGTGAAVVAPGIAAALGSAGILGAASTGTAISSLSGAALTSASLSAIGPAGLSIITATGAGLGGRAGFGIANSYLKDIPDYDFGFRRAPVKDSGHRIVFVNGFMTEDDKDGHDWCEGLEGYSDNSALWYLSWESKTLLELGKTFSGTGGNLLSGSVLAKAAGLASKQAAKSLSIASHALTLSKAASNPWHSAMLNAEKAGALLAEAISRTEGKTFTLMGHSLGARVVFFALLALATKDPEKRFVDKAILMGGAVGRTDTESWDSAASAVSEGIYNCYSNKDRVLQLLYQGANVGLSTPAGLGAASSSCDSVTNVDFSDLIDGHNAWKPNLKEVLARLQVS